MNAAVVVAVVLGVVIALFCQVERETRPGLVLGDTVCDEHLDDARRRGYRVRKSPETESRRTVR